MKILYTKSISNLCGAECRPRPVDAHNNQIYPDDVQRDFATKSLRSILKELETGQ